MPGAPRTNPAAPRGAQADLAARLRHGANVLQDRLNRRDTLVELIRSVNATLEPQKVADALLAHAQGWLPAPCLVVAVQDGPRQAALLAERGPCEPFGEGLIRVARWITEHNEEFMKHMAQKVRQFGTYLSVACKKGKKGLRSLRTFTFVLVAIFSVQNAAPITVHFLRWQITMSAALVIQRAPSASLLANPWPSMYWIPRLNCAVVLPLSAARFQRSIALAWSAATPRPLE